MVVNCGIAVDNIEEIFVAFFVAFCGLEKDNEKIFRLPYRTLLSVALLRISLLNFTVEFMYSMIHSDDTGRSMTVFFLSPKHHF